MLAHFLYSGHYQLPAAHVRLAAWYRAHVQSQEIRAQVKNYILDTNVLLHDPNSLLTLQGEHGPDPH